MLTLYKTPRNINKMNKLTFILLCVIALTSCNGKDKALKPNINGRAGEVLIVIEESLKKDSAGLYLSSMLNQSYQGLPQAEPVFNILTTPPHYFDKQMKYFRNIVIAEANANVEKDTIYFYESLWARGQAVVRASAKKPADLKEIIKRNEIKIISFFNRAERNRIIAYNKSVNYTMLTNEIRDQWNISVNLPTGYNKNKSSKDFTWISQETPTTSQGLMIYGFKYAGEGTFSKEFLLNKRDSLLRFNLEGPVPGSFMQTELNADLIYKSETIDNMEIAEIRGLWKTVGYAMGGPFLLRAHYNKATNYVVVTDGYIYFPDKPEKRNMMRQLEAIMYTVRFTDNQKQ